MEVENVSVIGQAKGASKLAKQACACFAGDCQEKRSFYE
jgi:hypothetical protein